MKSISKFLYYFYKTFIKVINIIGLFLIAVLGFLLFIIIFEIPFSVFNKYIQEKIFHNLVTIENVVLKWDYNIKKPVLVLNNMHYYNPRSELAFTFNYAGVSFDITKLLVKQKFYPIYIILEGFNLEVLRDSNNEVSFYGDNTKHKGIQEFVEKISDNNNGRVDGAEVNSTEPASNADNKNWVDNLSISNFKLQDLNNLLKEYKNQHEFLSLLNTVDINTSVVRFEDKITSKTFIINLDNVHLSYNTNTESLALETVAHIDESSLRRTINIKGSSITNNSDSVFFNYNVENLPLSLFILYTNVAALNKNVLTAGLYINSSIEGRYEFSTGLKAVKADIDTSPGELFIKDVLLDKVTINNIKTSLSYNAVTHKLQIPTFSINVDNTYPLKPKILGGGAFQVKSLSLVGDLDLRNNLYKFSNVKINLSPKNLSNKILMSEATYKDGELSFKLDSSNNITIEDLRLLWPQTYLPDIRNWVSDNVKKGTINQLQMHGGLSIGGHNVALAHIYGVVLLSNLEVQYLKGMPVAVAPKATLEFNKNSLNIKYFEATTGKVLSKSGEVILTNENPNGTRFKPVLKVMAKAEGGIVDSLLLINNKPLNVLERTHLDPYRFEGNVAGDVYLEYSFTKEALTDVGVSVTGHDIAFHKAFKDRDITHANLHLTVKNHNLVSYGVGQYYDMPVNVYIDANWDPAISYALKLNVDGKDVPITKLQNLDLIPEFLQDKFTGNLDFHTQLLHYKKKNEQTSTTNLDLTNTQVAALPYINYSKSTKVPLDVILKLTFKNHKLLEIKQLTLANKDISAQMKVAFNDDNSLNVVVNNLALKNKANLKGYLSIYKDSLNANITGQYLDLSWLKEGLAVGKKDNHEYSTTGSTSANAVPQHADKSYIIKANIKHVENNGVSLRNVYTNIDYSHNILHTLLVSSDIQDNGTITVVYDRPTQKIAYNISNLGEALKFFNVSTKLKRGTLNGQINFSQDYLKNILTDGVIIIKSFNVGIIPFSSARIAFTSTNLNFNIMDLVFKGNVLGGTLRGKYSARDKNLHLTGYITPIWSTSHLLVHIPILGDFLKSNFAQFFLSSGVNNKDQKANTNKGAVNIPFTIYGDIQNLQYVFSQSKTNVDNTSGVEYSPSVLLPSFYSDEVFNIFEFNNY